MRGRRTAIALAALAAVGAATVAAATGFRDNAAFIGMVPIGNTNVSFDYLVSVVPVANAANQVGAVAALPFVWGVYSIPLQRFLLGGGSGAPAATSTPQPTLTFPTFTAPTVTFQPPVTKPTGPIATFTIPTVIFQPPFTLPLPSRFTHPGVFDPRELLGPEFANVPLGHPPVDIDLSNVVFRAPVADDDVAVVPGIGQQEKELLANVGITSVGNLADADNHAIGQALSLNPEVGAALIRMARGALNR